MGEPVTNGKLTPEDLLGLVDAAMLQLIALRQIIVRYAGDPVDDDGGCKHLRQEEMLGGAIYCSDCGERLDSGHGVSAGADTGS